MSKAREVKLLQELLKAKWQSIELAMKCGDDSLFHALYEEYDALVSKLQEVASA